MQKKKKERFNKLQNDEDDETKKEKETEGADSDQSDNEAISNANQPIDFKTLADSQRIAAKANKKGMSVEEYQALSESESDSDDEAAKDPNSFVETIPYGYSFPLLLSSLERDRGYNTVFGKYPKNFNTSEGFLRTVETLTKFDVDKYGNRTRHNRRKQNEVKKKKLLDKKMYLYNLHNKKKVRSRIPKSTDNLHSTSFFGPIIKKKEKTWSSIQNKLRIYANDKSEYMLGKLRDDNADAVAEAKKFLAIDYPNKTDRQALTSYYVGKHAKKTDEWFKTRDQAGMISLTDELNYLQSAMELDETFSKTKFEKD